MKTEPVVFEAKDVDLKRFRLYNLSAGVIYLVQAIVLLVIPNYFRLPINISYPWYDTLTQAKTFLSVHIFDLRVGAIFAVVFLISALAHFLIGTTLFQWYAKNLARGVNYIRWWDYALTFSLLLVILVMALGISDLLKLTLIFALVAAVSLFGLMSELHNRNAAKPELTAFNISCLFSLVPWAVILLYVCSMALSVDNAVEGGSYAPAIFAFSLLFVLWHFPAINHFLILKKIGRWRDYLFGEQMYMVLALIVKSFFAWQIFF